MTSGYSAVGDLSCVILSIVIFALRQSTFINRTKRFKLVELAILLLSISSISNILFYTLQQYSSILPNMVFYALKFFYEIPLLAIFICFINYLDRLLQISISERRSNLFWIIFFLSIFALFTIMSPFTKFGFRIENGVFISPYFLNPFAVGYAFFIIIILYGLQRYRGFFIDRVYNCIIIVSSISVGIVLLEAMFRNSNYITMTFYLPIFMMFYLFHSSPYDFSIGTLNYESFNYYIDEFNRMNEDYGLVFANFNFSGVTIKLDLKSKKHLYSIYNKFFKRPYVFRIQDDLFCLVYRKKDFDINSLEGLKKDFIELYHYTQLDFKFILMNENAKMERVKDILSYYEYIAEKMEFNNFHVCSETDFDKFSKQQYILDELKDIATKGDLNDDRVLVYCQPIYNVEHDNFVTAEALMRLRLDKLGMVYPDMFIELAEKHEYIHALSKIILNKTCQTIKDLVDANYRIDRISVNISMREFEMESFCDDIISIIDQYDIGHDKIAIELTESEKNRNVSVKEKMFKLRSHGLYFYLDDYGSGYSNLERIMELPLDVIKFDRSLLLLSAESNNYKYMVDNFATVFSSLKYKILFEGVENEADENSCIDMKANYLQGYKYSKPIPIENLKEFLGEN